MKWFNPMEGISKHFGQSTFFPYSLEKDKIEEVKSRHLHRRFVSHSGFMVVVSITFNKWVLN